MRPDNQRKTHHGFVGRLEVSDSNIDGVLVCSNQCAHAIYRFLLWFVCIGWSSCWFLFVTRSGFLTKQMEGTLLPWMGRSRWPFERSMYWYWRAQSQTSCSFAHQRWISWSYPAHYPCCRDARDAHCRRSHHHIQTEIFADFSKTRFLPHFFDPLQQHNPSFYETKLVVCCTPHAT